MAVWPDRIPRSYDSGSRRNGESLEVRTSISTIYIHKEEALFVESPKHCLLLDEDHGCVDRS
jgi:hypothetical protein